MKVFHKFILFAFIALLLSNTPADIQEADENQKKIVTGIEEEIGRYHKDIEKSYNYLKMAGLVKANATRIPMDAHDIKYYTRKENHVYNSEMNVYWTADGKIRFIEIVERIAINRTFQRNFRIWLGQTQSDSHDDKKTITAYTLDFVSFLSNEYGDEKKLDFRINTGVDTGKSSQFLEFPDIPIKSEVFPVYVTEPNRRIKTLQEYQKLLQLAEVRMNYFIRKVKSADEEKLDYVLP